MAGATERIIVSAGGARRMIESVVRAGVLDVAVQRHGSPDGWPVVLLHGFPYDVHCYDEIAPRLAAAGADVVVPYLRGFGPTRFLSADTLRSGQQAALGHDLLALVDALDLRGPIVAGFDWGGRAACVVAALWPERVSGLVTVSGYNIQDIAASGAPQPPETERRLWYQYYLHSERGRSGLAAYRTDFARQLWSEWSPTWRFSDTTFEATAPSFENPDFVDVVVHSYRHRYAVVAGDPAYESSEVVLAGQPVIGVPTIVVDPTADALEPPQDGDRLSQHFTALVGHQMVDAGHNVPQEVPLPFAQAVLALHAG